VFPVSARYFRFEFFEVPGIASTFVEDFFGLFSEAWKIVGEYGDFGFLRDLVRERVWWIVVAFVSNIVVKTIS
jgi:hypothetical protein